MGRFFATEGQYGGSFVLTFFSFGPKELKSIS